MATNNYVKVIGSVHNRTREAVFFFDDTSPLDTARARSESAEYAERIAASGRPVPARSLWREVPGLRFPAIAAVATDDEGLSGEAA